VNGGMSKTTQITVTQIIGKDDDKIRWDDLFYGWLASRKANAKKDKDCHPVILFSSHSNVIMLISSIIFGLFEFPPP
jgi:hypothetical protein